MNEKHQTILQRICEKTGRASHEAIVRVHNSIVTEKISDLNDDLLRGFLLSVSVLKAVFGEKSVCSQCGDKFMYESKRRGEYTFCGVCVEDQEPPRLIPAFEYHGHQLFYLNEPEKMLEYFDKNMLA